MTKLKLIKMFRFVALRTLTPWEVEIILHFEFENYEHFWCLGEFIDNLPLSTGFLSKVIHRVPCCDLTLEFSGGSLDDLNNSPIGGNFRVSRVSSVFF